MLRTARGLAFLLPLVAGTAALSICLFRADWRAATPAAATQVASAAARAAPRLMCQHDVWRVGVVDPSADPRLHHTFVLKNASKRPVEIRGVRADCGCTVVDNHPRTVPPGGATEISVVLDVVGPPGPFAHTVVAQTAPPIEKIPLKIVGRRAITAMFLARPRVVDFGSLFKGEKKVRRLHVARHDKSALMLKSATCPQDGLSVDARAGRSPGSAELKLELDSRSLAIGQFLGQIIVTTSHPRYESLSVAVRAMIRQPRGALVDSILVAGLTAGETRAINLCDIDRTHRGGARFAGWRYEGDESIDVRVRETRDAWVARLRLRSDAEFARDARRGGGIRDRESPWFESGG